MSDLLARLEAATEGSSMLDNAIYDALWGLPRMGGDYRGHTVPIPPEPYTTSIDAALTLLPEGWKWSVDSSGCAWVCPVDADSAYTEMIVIGGVTIPALALCIAALKARERAGA